MRLRYDFDPGQQRKRLREAMAELRRLNYGPRRETRVPLALKTEAKALNDLASGLKRAVELFRG